MAKWVEYMTSEGDSPMARLRRQNGRDKAWKVKFIGVGEQIDDLQPFDAKVFAQSLFSDEGGEDYED